MDSMEIFFSIKVECKAEYNPAFLLHYQPHSNTEWKYCYILRGIVIVISLNLAIALRAREIC
jgi:hypothetical protein